MKAIQYIILAAVLVIGSTVDADDDDLPTLEYYITRVDSVLALKYLFNDIPDFSVTIESNYYRTNYRAEIDKSDTAAWRVSYTGGKAVNVAIVDSAGEIKNTLPDDFAIQPLWNESYHYYFYPNDPGVGRLSIGFESPEPARGGLISGFFSFDRDSYYLQTVTLYYVEVNDADHLSRVYHFTVVDSLPVLSELEIHRKKGILTGSKYYRETLRFSDYDIR